MIDDTIDFEESSLQHRVVVKRHVDEELDEMKRMYDGLDDMLGEVARQIAAGVPGPVQSTLNVIYFPQLGYLIVVPGSSTVASGRPSYTGEDWEFQFSTETSWYYKSPEMREMDSYFGDMYGLICGGFRQRHLTSDI